MLTRSLLAVACLPLVACAVGSTPEAADFEAHAYHASSSAPSAPPAVKPGAPSQADAPSAVVKEEDPAWAWHSCPSRRYTLLIDDDFTPAEAAVIEASMGEWVAASHGAINVTARIIHDPSFELYNCSMRVQRHNHPDSKNMGYTVVYSNADRTASAARTWVRDDVRDPAELRAVVVHELGHALGLDHSGRDDMESCMWAYITIGCSITAPTRERLCAVWGCQAEPQEDVAGAAR